MHVSEAEPLPVRNERDGAAEQWHPGNTGVPDAGPFPCGRRFGKLLHSYHRRLLAVRYHGQ